MALKLTVRETQGVTVVDASGRIVLGEETATLREQVKALLSLGKKQIVLNMAQVDFIDSSGLGALVGLNTSAGTQGAQINLAALAGRARELLQMTKLLTIFDVYETEEAAVVSFIARNASA